MKYRKNIAADLSHSSNTFTRICHKFIFSLLFNHRKYRVLSRLIIEFQPYSWLYSSQDNN